MTQGEQLLINPCGVASPPRYHLAPRASISSGATLGILNNGKTNVSLVAGLEARGAQVIHVPVYRWGFPEDTSALEENLRALSAAQRDVVMFTSAHQVTHVQELAMRMGLAEDVRMGLQSEESSAARSAPRCGRIACAACKAGPNR